MIGRVVSIKMKNTVTVLITRVAKHPLYKKAYVQSKKYLADDNAIEVKLGDMVEIIKIRPISKNKHWQVARVIGRNIEEIISEHLQEKGTEEIAEVMEEKPKKRSGKNVSTA